MRLILYDIDGTLTRSQNGFAPFNEAIFTTFGFAGDIRNVVPDGNTDPMIVKEIFVKANVEMAIARAQWEQFALNLRQSYADAVAQGKTTIRPLPGVLELLSALAADKDISQGVVTGNFEATAQLKLAAAGLVSFLCCGAYADDSAHRPDLPGIAKERWEKSSGRAIASQHCVIVGDTPKDLEAARQNGMKCVLVGTGRYPVEELEYYKPDATVPDLTDTDTMVEIFLQV